MPIKTIDANTLKHWMEAGEAVVVDVREPAEHAAENIPGAKLIPLATINKSILPEYSGKKLVIHCRSGKRSTNACEKLLTEDPNLEIYNLEGGISAWGALGNELKISGKLFIPLDRQVQLTIGILLILCSILGYMITPLLFILTGLIGIGLTIAGITGFCGLSKVVAKMPWNQKI